MQFVASFEVESDVSVVSDEMTLKIEDPNSAFRARIKNIVREDFSTPFLLTLHLFFDAPNLDEAKDSAMGRLAECLNMLAFITGAGVRWYRTKKIVDCTPTAGMRDCLLWSDVVDNEDPISFLDEEIAASIEHLLKTEQPPSVKRAMRWYRIGVHERAPDDQFQYFWFAFEILAEHEKPSEKVHDSCPKCRTPLYCRECDTHPVHRPYPKQAIRSLTEAIRGSAEALGVSCDDDTIDKLESTRNALMHGATLKEVEADPPDSKGGVVDTLGRLVFIALLHQFSSVMADGTKRFGFPSTYLHHMVHGVAHLQTIFPMGDDGELDPDGLPGTTMSVVTDPPQSAQPSIIVMTEEQHHRIGALAWKKGDHQDLCRRVYERIQRHDGRIVALVLSTDLARIDKAIQDEETGAWQDLFREILKPSEGEAARSDANGGQH